MPRGIKTCPQCQETMGPRTKICPSCKYDFHINEQLPAEVVLSENGENPPESGKTSEGSFTADVTMLCNSFPIQSVLEGLINVVAVKEALSGNVQLTKLKDILWEGLFTLDPSKKSTRLPKT